MKDAMLNPLKIGLTPIFMDGGAPQGHEALLWNGA